MGLLEIKMGLYLSDPSYTIYLIPFLFLAAGVHSSIITNVLTAKQFYISLGLIVGFSLIFLSHSSQFLSIRRAISFLVDLSITSYWLFLTVGLFALALNRNKPRSKTNFWIFIWLLTLNLIVLLIRIFYDELIISDQDHQAFHQVIKGYAPLLVPALHSIFLGFLIFIFQESALKQIVSLILVTNLAINFSTLDSGLTLLYSCTNRASEVDFSSAQTVKKNEDSYIAIRQASDALKRLDATQDLLFWYNFSESNQGEIFRAVASPYIPASQLINEQFPLLQTQTKIVGTQDNSAALLELGKKVVILSDVNTNSDVLSQKALSDYLSKHFLTTKPLLSQTIQVGELNFRLLVLLIDLDLTQFEQQLAYVLDSSQNSWTPSNTIHESRFDSAQNLLTIKTKPSLYDWLLMSSPLTLEKQSKYLVELTYSLQQGGLAINAIEQGASKSLMTQYWCESPRHRQTLAKRQMILETQNAERLNLFITNFAGGCSDKTSQASVFQIREVRLYRQRKRSEK
jgi:hypothetical protein